MRASRVRKLFSRSFSERSLSYRKSARAMPCMQAPAWPVLPPPCTVIRTSTLSRTPACSSGATTAPRSWSIVKKSASSRSLITSLPLPARIRTRATEVLRRPVPRASMTFSAAAGMLLSFDQFAFGDGVRLVRGQFGGDWLLTLMGMFGAGVDFQLSEHLVGQLVLRQHPPHGLGQNSLR